MPASSVTSFMMRKYKEQFRKAKDLPTILLREASEIIEYALAQKPGVDGQCGF